MDRCRVGRYLPCQRGRVDGPEPEKAGTRERNAGERLRTVHLSIVAGCQRMGRGHVDRKFVLAVRPVRPSGGFAALELEAGKVQAGEVCRWL